MPLRSSKPKMAINNPSLQTMVIIALKAPGRDCTNNNELLLKIGVLQRCARQLFVFTSEFFKRFDGALSITVVFKASENKAEGLSPRLRVRAPVKLFFIFLFFAFAKKQDFFFAIYMFAEKKHVLMYYAHVKRLHSVKWRGFRARK